MEQALAAGGPVTVPMPRSSAVAAIGNGLRSHPPRQHRTVRREGQLGPRPAVMKPEIHRAKTHCIRGFMALRLARPTPTVMLMVSV
jgi:hypothetical protein